MTIQHPIDFILENTGEGRLLEHIYDFTLQYYDPKEGKHIEWPEYPAVDNITPANIRSVYAQMCENIKGTPLEVQFSSECRDTEIYDQHIPVIDCVHAQLPFVKDLARMLSGHWRCQTAVFSTGRGWHIYMATTLRPRHLMRYLGNLILLNDSNATVVDTKWVAQSLVTGAMHLRWSCNTSNYLQQPTIVD